MPGRASSCQHADTVGRTRMITLITPLRPFRILMVRFFFLLSRIFPSILGIEPMKAVHFTYWTLVTRMPYNGPPQALERPKRPWILWGSVFNADIDPYVEAFVAVVAPQINLTWGGALGFPGTKSVVALRSYIEDLATMSAYRYSAYPDATVRTVLSAFEIAREQPYLEAAANGDADEIARVYRGFLSRREQDF